MLSPPSFKAFVEALGCGQNAWTVGVSFPFTGSLNAKLDWSFTTTDLAFGLGSAQKDIAELIICSLVTLASTNGINRLTVADKRVKKILTGKHAVLQFEDLPNTRVHIRIVGIFSESSSAPNGRYSIVIEIDSRPSVDVQDRDPLLSEGRDASEQDPENAGGV